MTTQLPYLICSILSFVPAIVLHEMAHGFAAWKLGDPTAKRAGRLSFNPLAHVDPFGTVIMPFLLMAMNMPVFGYDDMRPFILEDLPIFMIVAIMLPYIIHVNVFGIYLDVTAGNLGNLLFPFTIS